mgnify:CR=1 FL=1
MKKIAHICTVASSHTILMDKLSYLQKKGYEIHIISSKAGLREEFTRSYKEIIPKFIDIKRSIQPVSDIISLIRIYRLIKKEGYEIVHTHTAKAGFIGRLAAKLAGVPLIIHTSHGLPFYEGQNKYQYLLYRQLEKLASTFCDAIFSQNHEEIPIIEELAPTKPVHYEGNGVDIHRLDRVFTDITDKELNNLRQKWNIDNNCKITLVGARFEPVKDHLFLLESLKALKESGCKNFICLLAGKGPLENQIRKKIFGYELEHNVKIIGYQTNIYPYIKLSDIVVLTSQKEGVPRIIMEAMAFSKPVVATDVLGTRELVEHNVTGILVPYKDVQQLATALSATISNGQLRRDLGAKGRRRVEQGFTEEVVSHRIDKLYRKYCSC